MVYLLQKRFPMLFPNWLTSLKKNRNPVRRNSRRGDHGSGIASVEELTPRIMLSAANPLLSLNDIVAIDCSDVSESNPQDGNGNAFDNVNSEAHGTNATGDFSDPLNLENTTNANARDIGASREGEGGKTSISIISSNIVDASGDHAVWTAIDTSTVPVEGSVFSNSAPVLNLIGSEAEVNVAYNVTLGGLQQVSGGTLTITDADEGDWIDSGTVVIEQGFQSEDLVDVTTVQGITVTRQGHMLLLDGSASAATYEEVLRTLAFRTTSVDEGARMLSIQVTDSAGNTSQPLQLTVHLTATAGNASQPLNLVMNLSAGSDFAPIDVDQSGGSPAAQSDGLLLFAVLGGVTSTAQLSSLVSPAATRGVPDIVSHVEELRSQQILDVDGNGGVFAQSDGLLIFAILAGVTDSTQLGNLIGSGATRTIPQIIEYVQALGTPPSPTASSAAVVSVSPADGESLVSLTRETIVNFSAEVDPATVTSESFYVIAKGTRIPGRIRVSATERFATFFYDDPLPESTAVRVYLDGDRIMGRDGQKLDANSNGQPGGVGRFEFRTLPLSLISNTSVWGYVYDSYHVIPQEQFSISVPTGDPHFDPASNGQATIAFARADFFPGTGDTLENPRLHPNRVTSFIDASSVYGSDEARARALRMADGSGRLKTSDDNLLPMNNLQTFPGGVLANENKGSFPDDSLPVAGDLRAAEFPGLAAIHTLFVREHNRKADEIKAAHPNWSDELVYQHARRWVTALIQHITYQEYLPTLLGPDAIPAYSGYDSGVDPSISVLFASAAFRVGHSQQASEILRLDADENSLSGGALALREAFFNPEPLTSDGIDPYLRGLIAQRAEEVDTRIVDDLRNFLFGPPGAGGLDLAAIGIQRGRDMGLPSYVVARELFGLPTISGFDQITSNVEVTAALQSVYGTVDKIDLWVGGLAEDHVSGGSVGPLFAAILADQFIRSRDGDRFWYENGQLPGLELADIRSTSFADVIMQNSGVTNLSGNVFLQGAAPSGPAAAGEAGSPSEFRSYDGTRNNFDQPWLASTNRPLLPAETVGFGDGRDSMGGTDRPNPRTISNRVFSQRESIPSSVGLTSMSVVFGQFLSHDLSFTPAQSIKGTDIPVVGAKLSLDALPNVSATTDRFGFFELGDAAGLPVPDFFVHIDGSTAINAPAGARYATLGKPFHSVVGQSVPLKMDGEAFHVYLPPMFMEDIVELDSSITTDVGLGSSLLNDPERLAEVFPHLTPAQRASLSEMQVTYPAGSARDQHDEPATLATVVPVNPNRLPAPLPPGVDPGLVVSIQAGVLRDGQPSFNRAGDNTSFDVPAPVRFPNLDGLVPGQQSLIWSFDHDAGRWITIGTGTVTSDGSAIVSDPGVGVLAPGWHFTNPGVNVSAEIRQLCHALLGPMPTQFQADLDFIKEVFFGVASFASKGNRLLEGVVSSLGIVKDVTAPRDSTFNSVYNFYSANVNANALIETMIDNRSSLVEGLGIANMVFDVGRATMNVFNTPARIEAYRQDLAKCIADLSAIDQGIRDMAEATAQLQAQLDEATLRIRESMDRTVDMLEGLLDLLDHMTIGGQQTIDFPSVEGRQSLEVSLAEPAFDNPSTPNKSPTPAIIIPPRATQGGNDVLTNIISSYAAGGTPVFVVPAPTAAAADAGDSISTAAQLPLEKNSGVAVDQVIGDNIFGKNDVDIYRVELEAGDFVSVELLRVDSGFYFATLRLFDDQGAEIALDVDSGTNQYPANKLFSSHYDRCVLHWCQQL
jgi:hypothetical protein